MLGLFDQDRRGESACPPLPLFGDLIRLDPKLFSQVYQRVKRGVKSSNNTVATV